MGFTCFGVAGLLGFLGIVRSGFRGCKVVSRDSRVSAGLRSVMFLSVSVGLWSCCL